MWSELGLFLALFTVLAYLSVKLLGARVKSKNDAAAQPADLRATTAVARPAALVALRHEWLTAIKPDFLPGVLEDPVLSSVDETLDTFLNRLLAAESRSVPEEEAVLRAATRLRRTAAFRRDYAVPDFHRQGMARALMMHATNAGASLYFADVRTVRLKPRSSSLACC